MTRTSTPPRQAASVFDPSFCATGDRRSLLWVAILTSALGFIDGSVVSIALPAIRLSLDASLAQAQWVTNAYLLTLTALMLTASAIWDRFGLARTFAAGIAVFVIASILCALAPTANTLIWARFVQGIGAAIMIPGSLALVARTYPREERGAAIGTWAAAAALTTAIGPIIGGLALTLGGDEMWRWIFAANLPLGSLAIWLLYRYAGPDRRPDGQSIDLAGAISAALGLGAFTWALIALSGESEGGPAPALLLAAAVVFLAVFVWVELRNAAPMLPFSIFRNRPFVAANLVTVAIYTPQSMVLFFLPMLVISGWNIREIGASALLAPLAIFLPLMSSWAGRMSDRHGPGPLLAAGSGVLALSYAAIALAVGSGNYWGRLIPAMMILGFGMGLVVAPLSTAVMTSVEETRTGLASSINNVISRLAGMIAVAGSGALIALGYRSAGGSASFGIPSDTQGHVAAMETAFVSVIWVACALTAAASLLALTSLRRYPSG